MSNWRKSFKKTFKKAFSALTVLAVIFSSLAPVARAAVTESAAPAEVLLMPSTSVKGNTVIATDEITFVQASGTDTLISVGVIIAGSGGLISADIASVSLRKESGATTGFQTGEDNVVAGASVNTPTLGAAVILTPTAPETIGATPVKYYIVIVIAANPGNGRSLVVSLPSNYATISVGGPTGTQLNGTKSVLIDLTGPSIVSVEKINPSAVEVIFNEVVQTSTATNGANYAFSGGLTVIDSVQQGPNNFRIVASGDITPGTTTLTVSANVLDLAGNANASTTAQTVVVPVKVKISEVAPEIGSAASEFVELYNGGGNSVDISGWKLQYDEATADGWTDIATIPSTPSTTLAQFKFYLISTVDFNTASPVVDGDTTMTAGLALAGGHLRIVNGAGTTEFDKIGWGTATSPEGMAIVALDAAGKSLERKAFGSSTATGLAVGGMDATKGNGWDTNNNSFDFVVQISPSAQNFASALEDPMAGGGGGGGMGPMINHMPINIAPSGAALEIIAQMGDPMTPIDQISAELHYAVGDGSPANNVVGDYTTVLGVHQSNGYFKFTVPQATVDDTNTIANGLYYYLKLITNGGTRFMSASSTVDMGGVGSGLTYATIAAKEAAVAQNPFNANIDVSTGWTKHNIIGTVKDSTTANVEGALIFLEGTGYNTATAADGTFTLASVKDGIYNLVIVKSGFYEGWVNNIFLNGADKNIGIQILNLGTGGGMTGDNTKPFAMWTGPPDGMFGVPSGDANFKVFIGFSKDLDGTTFNNTNVFLTTNGTTPIVSAVNYDPADRTNMPPDPYLGIVSAPATVGFAANTTYYLVMTGNVRDTAGNALQGNRAEGGHTISFTTGMASGSLNFGNFGTGAMMPPFVMGVTPSDGAMNVVTNAKININFSDPMDSTTVNSTNIQLYKITFSGGSEVKTPVSLSAVALDTSGKVATLTPSSALTAGKHRVVVTGALKSATGIWMGNPGALPPQNTSTYEFYQSGFEVGTNSDSTDPTVLGSWPANANTNIPVNPGMITIQFSEGMAPSTINSNTITLKRGTSAVTGNASYDSMSQSASFSPSVVLATSTDYTLTVTTGVTDAVGNALAQNYVAIFTTGAAGDATAPSIMFANGDEYGVAITFSEAMKSANATDTTNWGASVLNPANYIVKWGDPSTVAASGTAINLSTAGAQFKYDGMSNTVMIDNLGLTYMAGKDYYIDMTTSSATDLSGNLISTGAVKTFRAPINSSAMTNGMLGPMMGGGMGGPMGPDMGNMGMMSAGVFPMNAMAGQTTVYFVDVPTTKAIPIGGKIVLTFPTGFDVTNADKDSFSPVNNDINEWNAGTITISVAKDQSMRKITITTGTSATQANDFLHMDIKGIVNSSIPRGFDTSGYSVDMKTMDDNGNLLETITGMPFFINAGGTNSLVVTVNGVTSGDNGDVRVFLGSPMTGPMEKIVNFSGVETFDTETFSSLPAGQYMLFTEPTITLGSSDYAGMPMPQSITIDGANTKTIALAKQGAGSGAAITVNITGVFGTDNIDVFAGSPIGFKVKTITNAGTNPAPVILYLPAGNWMVGIGPAMPKGPMAGPPPMPDWMPPMPTQIVSNGTTSQSVNISISTASMQIIGYVTDGVATVTHPNGTPIADAEAFAYQPMGMGMGAHGKTDTNGMFTLKVATAGTYSVGVFKPGLPGVPDRTVKVAANVNGADGNDTAEVTVDGALITAANKFIFNLQKSTTTISGKVTNGTNPVSFAPVWAYQASGTGHADTMTDSAGNYILYVANGSWTIQANIPGYGDSQAQTVVVNGSSMTQNIAPDSSVTYYTISGTISINGALQTYMPIRAVEYNSNGNYLGKEYGGQTNSSGVYSISVPGSVSGKYYRVDTWTPEFGEVGLTVADEVASSPANVIITNANKTGKDITIAGEDLKIITLAFTNGTASQTGMVNIDGVLAGKPTGFHKTIKLSALNASSSVKLAAGSYMFRMDVPGLGGFTPVSNPVAVSADADVTFILPFASGDNQNIFNITGTITSGATPLAGAWVWVGNPTTGVHFGTTTANNGAYSLAVKAGTYNMGVEMPGYAPQQPTNIEVLADKPLTNYSLTATNQFITGRIFADTVTVNNSYDAGEAVANGWVRVEETTSKKIFGAPTGLDGTFSIGVENGTYILKGVAEGYAETGYGSPIIVTGSGAASKNIKLTADANWSAKLKSKPMTPASGGTVDDSMSAGTGVKIVVPPNALGSSTSSGNIKAKEVSSVSKTSSAQPLGNKGKEITAQDNSGQAITTLNDDIEIELNYYKADIVEADVQDMGKLDLLANSYWDSSVSDWVPMSTTKKAYTKENASDAEWTAQSNFSAFVDALETNPNTYGDYKITLQSTTGHLTIFGATIPSDLIAPSAPTGLAQTSGSGTSVVLDWNNNSEADLLEYEVYRSASASVAAINANQKNVTQLSTSAFTDSTAAAWNSYYYTVTAVDDSGNESAVATEIRVCSNSTVANGTVANTCAITCNSGYTQSGNSCVAQGGGGGGSYTPSDTTPPTGTSIIISGGAAEVANKSVILHFTATDAVWMMISNASDFAGVSWETYIAKKEWTLTLGNGIKTVYAKFKDAAGNISAAVSDTITLNETSIPTTEIPSAESATSYPDGALLKASDAPEVYVIKSGNKVWIKSAEEFNAAGYKWEDIKAVSGEVLKSVGSVTLIKVAGDPRVYVLHNNKKQHIKSAEEFNAAGYKWENIVLVSKAEADSYTDDNAALGKAIVITTPWLRVRALNTTKSAEMGRVSKNENYSVLEESNGWYKIQTAKGITGWVSGTYAAIKTESAAISGSGSTIIINAPVLRIRSLNSASGKILGQTLKGEAYSVLEEKSGWYKIKTGNGIIGWVSGQYATKK